MFFRTTKIRTNELTFDFAGSASSDSRGKQRDAPGRITQHGKRLDDHLRNTGAGQHHHESENGCPNKWFFDRFPEFGCENR